MGRTELRTEVEIQAPPARVYAVLQDFARYHEWNPFITAVVGEAAVGAQLALELSLPGGKEHRLKATLLNVEPEAELRWRSRSWLRGLLDGEHFFQLSSPREGVTRFVQGENFSGILLGFATETLTQTARGFVYMNEALKKRVEKG
jgi:hypothetical protein